MPASDLAAKPRLFQLRMALIYAAIMAANGFFLPYFPLWLEAVDLGPTAIAVILAVPMFLRVATTPPIAAYADRGRDRAGILTVCVGATLLFSLGYFLPPHYWLVLSVSILLSVPWSAEIALADSIALSGVRRFGADYAGMRIWGSIGYLVANLGGGFLLGWTGAGAVPALFSTSMAMALLFCFFAPRLGAPRARLAGGGTPLLRQPYFVLFVTAAGLIQASHAFVYSFSSIYWKSLGIGDAVIGALWAFGVLAEVLVFALFTRLFGRTSPLAILFMTGVASVLRWVLFPLVWPLGFGLAGFFAVQALHSISTGLMLIGVQVMIGQSVPEHQTGSAQGISFFATNAALAAATLASGPLYAKFGAGGFFAMAAIAAAGLGFVLLARGFPQPQSAGSAGKTVEPS